jgi:hypothetical protein
METMQAGCAFTDLPAWLAWFCHDQYHPGHSWMVSYKFIQEGNYHAAHANWMTLDTV